MILERALTDLSTLHKDFAHFSHCALRKKEQTLDLERIVGFISVVGLILATLSALNLAGLKPLGIQLCPHGDPTALVVSLAVSSLFPLIKARAWATSHNPLQHCKKRIFLHDSDLNTSIGHTLPPYSATLVRVKNEQIALYIKENEGWALEVTDFQVDEDSVDLKFGEKLFPVIRSGKSNPIAVYLYLKEVKEAQLKGLTTVEENPHKSLHYERDNLDYTNLKIEKSKRQKIKTNRKIALFVISISFLLAAAIFVSIASLSHSKYIPIHMNPRLAVALSVIGGSYFTWCFYEFGKTYFNQPPTYNNLCPKHKYPNAEIAKQMLTYELFPFERGFVYIGNPTKRYFAIRLDKETLLLPVFANGKPDQLFPQHKNKLVFNPNKEELSFIDKDGKRVLLSTPYKLFRKELYQLLNQLAS
jgi:hypothetical protein